MAELKNKKTVAPKKAAPKKTAKTIVPRAKRKQLTGIVVSTKMQKTIVVEVESYKKHPLYSKRFLSTKKFKAHDETGIANQNDKVLIVETKPYSKTKTFRLVKVIEASKDGA